MKALLTISLAVLASIGFSQNIWIADNRPTAPAGAHVFANITNAIAAASPGDIIHVIPSQVFYPDFTVTKDSLTIFGIGFNPDKDQPNKAWVNNLTIATGVFGTRISGLNVDDDLTIGTADGSVGNLFIENGDIDVIQTTTAANPGKSLSNVVIRNCIIGQRESAGVHVINLIQEANPTSIVITNNVIMGSSHTGSYGSINVADAIIKNNLFLGNGTNDFAFNSVNTSTISNNVFFGRNPNSDPLAGGISNSTFSNNISFGASDNRFPVDVSGNTGDTTGYTNVDPLMTNVPLVDNWLYNYDPSPTGAPLVGTGNDGNDIGVTGGTIPFSSTGSPLPVIKVLRVPEVIKEGTNLSATIEAFGN